MFGIFKGALAGDLGGSRQRTGETTKATVHLRVLCIAVIFALAALASLSVASATTHKPIKVAPDAVLTWNTNAVNAVRASSPAKFQVEGLIYMSYVQAAVYDAVTKIAGGYKPYHDFTFAVVPGASVQAAVAAAARTTLDNYLPDQQATVDAEYNSLHRDAHGGRRGRRRGRQRGGRRHHRAPDRRRPQRSNADLRHDRADPARPVAAADARPDSTDAVGRDDAAVPAPAALAVPGRAAAFTDQQAVRQRPERDRSLRSAQQHRPHLGRDRDGVLLERKRDQPVQPDDAERHRPAQHGHRRCRAPDRDGGARHNRRRDRLFRLQVLLPRLASDHRDPERRQGRQPRHDRRPGMGTARSPRPPIRNTRRRTAA